MIDTDTTSPTGIAKDRQSSRRQEMRIAGYEQSQRYGVRGRRLPHTSYSESPRHGYSVLHNSKHQHFQAPRCSCRGSSLPAIAQSNPPCSTANFFLSYPYLSLSLGHRAWASRRLVPSCHQSTKVVILLFTPERRCDAFKLIATAALDSILYARAKTCSLP